jgi:hypothetical protein
MEHVDLIDVVYNAGSVATRAAMVPAHAHVHALPSAPPPSAAPYVNKRMTRQQSDAAAKKAQKQVANAAALAVAENKKQRQDLQGLRIIP